ncbi:MAG: transposase [Planctomycetaceae bacterium]
MILQQLHDLTDQQTTEAVALNMAWHYALDIRHEPDAHLCERTLRNDRNRILESRLDEVLPARLDGPVNREGRIGHEPAAVGFDDGPVRDRGLTRLCVKPVRTEIDARPQRSGVHHPATNTPTNVFSTVPVVCMMPVTNFETATAGEPTSKPPRPASNIKWAWLACASVA